MKEIQAIELGATLFIPAKHKNIYSIVYEKKYPDLRSVVIDFEDGLSEADVENSLLKLEQLLIDTQAFCLIVIVRPRSVEMFEKILALEKSQKIDAYILPKFSLHNMDKYLLHVENARLQIMPSIEGVELFDVEMLKKVRDRLLAYTKNIILIRFGAEDMMRQLSLKRDCEHSLFDIHTTAHVITSLIMTFKPYGFDISAPVFVCFKDEENYIKQIKQEFREGLVSKTIIHPNQIAPLHNLYKVSAKELASAKKLLISEEAVFSDENSMAEVSTQSDYAKTIIKRYELFGILL